MKQRLLFLSLLLTCTVGAYSDDQVSTLIVTTKSGAETSFFLKDKPQVKFEGTDLKVTSSAGDATFALADVLRFTYAMREASGISETLDPETGITFKDNMLVISQVKQDSFVGVYSLDGKLVRQFTLQHSGTFRLSLSELPSGLYLVKAGNTTYKITKP
jgi:hypothetical protein